MGALATTSCTDETIVFRDRELFEEPLAAAAGAVGYSNQESKLTVCGNCHVGPQLEWEETGHAEAWVGLQDSGHAAEFCEGCHTVSEYGQDYTGDSPMGWTGAAEDRYHDVQCESCHGPGLEHVQSPADANVPWAPGEVGTAEVTTGCGECHSGAHHPYAQQFFESKHYNISGYPQGRAYCAYCHTGEDALESWGVQSDWIEKDTYVEGSGDPADHMTINCMVCHDPHGSEHEGQLRFAVDIASEQDNLCMKCHHKRGIPDITSFRGPHSPQGPLLLGEAGYWPPDLENDIGRLEATHGTEANPRLCAGCHVNAWEVTDQATGEFVFNATGHSFEATPCVDENGLPTGGSDCAEEDKYYQGCAVSGCHGSANSARSAMLTARLRIDDLASRINALLAEVPESEFDTDDNRYSPAEGARFNAGFAEFSGSGAHNPFLVEAIMIASINQLVDFYGLEEAPGQSPLTRQLISDGDPDSFATFQQ
jgi:predicted CXXCH cytochrome family protein